jgi:hypothetical protein
MLQVGQQLARDAHRPRLGLRALQQQHELVAAQTHRHVHRPQPPGLRG